MLSSTNGEVCQFQKKNHLRFGRRKLLSRTEHELRRRIKTSLKNNDYCFENLDIYYTRRKAIFIQAGVLTGSEMVHNFGRLKKNVSKNNNFNSSEPRSGVLSFGKEKKPAEAILTVELYLLSLLTTGSIQKCRVDIDSFKYICSNLYV